MMKIKITNMDVEDTEAHTVEVAEYNEVLQSFGTKYYLLPGEEREFDAYPDLVFFVKEVSN